MIKIRPRTRWLGRNSGAYSLTRLLPVACVALFLSDPVLADNKCPKSKRDHDPFADLDASMTKEEKRKALHKSLDEKLARQKAECVPEKPGKTVKSAKKSQDKAQQTARNNGEDAAGQGAAKTTDQSVNGNSTSQGSSTGGKQDRNTGQDSSSQNSQSVPGQAGTGGQSTSQKSAQAPVSSLPSASLSGQDTLPASANGGQSGAVSGNARPATKAGLPGSPVAATGVSGSDRQAGEKVNSTSGETSHFLDAYGTGKSSEPAGQHDEKGSPGHTGTKQTNSKSRTTAGKAQGVKVINANEAAIEALQKRLKTEKDPEMRKKIQSEIEKLKK